MDKVTKNAKVEMIIGAAIAIASMDVTKYSCHEDTLDELNGLLVEMCVMFCIDYLDANNTEEASYKMADWADKASRMCNIRAENGLMKKSIAANKTKPGIIGVDIDTLRETIGEEAFDKVKKMIEDGKN